MIHLILAAALSAAPAPQPAPSVDHASHHQGMKHGDMKHEGAKDGQGCSMPCCKDKPMSCCEKKDAKPAEAPGGHQHDH